MIALVPEIMDERGRNGNQGFFLGDKVARGMTPITCTFTLHKSVFINMDWIYNVELAL
jgi:hypothetical protein